MLHVVFGFFEVQISNLHMICTVPLSRPNRSKNQPVAHRLKSKEQCMAKCLPENIKTIKRKGLQTIARVSWNYTMGCSSSLMKIQGPSAFRMRGTCPCRQCGWEQSCSNLGDQKASWGDKTIVTEKKKNSSPIVHVLRTTEKGNDSIPWFTSQSVIQIPP